MLFVENGCPRPSEWEKRLIISIGIVLLMNPNSTLYRFLNNRPLMHSLFWLLYIAFYGLMGGGYDDKYAESFVRELIQLPVKLTIVYFTMYVLIPRFLLRKQYWSFGLGLIASMILAGILQRTANYYIYYPLYYPGLQGEFFSAYQISKYVLNINSVVILTAGIKILKYWYVNEQMKGSLEKEKLAAELKFLKAQIHPHFLFNTLNNLYSLTLQKSEKAPEVVLRLSGLMNYILYEANSRQVSLAKEIESIHNYIALEKIRYGDSLEISFDVSGNINGSKVAPMLLVPFVENSFKHGVSDEISDKWITINLNLTDDWLTFKVENSRSFPQPEREKVYAGGIGLKNVKRRLELIYPDCHELKILEEANSYLIVMRLLLHKTSEQLVPNLVSL